MGQRVPAEARSLWGPPLLVRVTGELNRTRRSRLEGRGMLRAADRPAPSTPPSEAPFASAAVRSSPSRRRTHVRSPLGPWFRHWRSSFSPPGRYIQLRSRLSRQLLTRGGVGDGLPHARHVAPVEQPAELVFERQHARHVDGTATALESGPGRWSQRRLGRAQV